MQGCLRESGGDAASGFPLGSQSYRLTFLPHCAIEQETEASALAWTNLRRNDWMQNFTTQPPYREDIAPRALGAEWPFEGELCRRARWGRGATRGLCGGHERSAVSLTGPAELGLGEAAATFSNVLGRTVIDLRP